jgi:hypothetical protein
MKQIAWYDPTNGMVSTDKDSSLFTPLGQVWPLYTNQEQEPVAWFSTLPDGRLSIKIVGKPTEGNWEPLYTTPPQRTWVGLTDEERDGKRVFENGLLFNSSEVQVWELAVQWAEAKLKEKNT